MNANVQRSMEGSGSTVVPVYMEDVILLDSLSGERRRNLFGGGSSCALRSGEVAQLGGIWDPVQARRNQGLLTVLYRFLEETEDAPWEEIQAEMREFENSHAGAGPLFAWDHKYSF